MPSDNETFQVELISRVTDFHFTDEWYEHISEDHFWFHWRRIVIISQASDLKIPLDKELKVLEVGCGTGLLRAQMENATSWIIDGADLNLSALKKSKAFKGRTMLYDITEEKPSFVNSYDVVILYDVLEHIEATRKFLSSAIRHLKPGGILLVNVPALSVFFSPFDRAMGHFRRYDKKSLSLEFKDMGMDILDMRYWGMSMLPLLAARKVVMSVHKFKGEKTIRYGFNVPGAFSLIFQHVMTGLMRLETACFKSPVLGTSLLLAGKRNA
ncbi:MAG: methyltransferase domain-containing protein [Candidatus Aureabacteria bacterium]|nr:methyltransferase domain-containing protein [Candidatus Auribacterota bacterium]